MFGPLGGPRLLLRRLREVMAEPISAQERLDKIVIHIAANMVAEVCSVYVLKADGRLELFATEGLNREAVHLTTMRAGEGLVGLIAETAEPLALADAQASPVLQLSAGNGRGNLLLLPRRADPARRQYARRSRRAEPGAAHLFGRGSRGAADDGDAARRDDRFGRTAIDRPARTTTSPCAGLWRCKARPLADGVGLGHVVLHEPRIIIKQLVAEDVKKEQERLDAAIGELRKTIDNLIEDGDVGPGEHREVLEAFRMFAHDRGWIRRLREAVATGLTAEAAVERVQNDARAKLQRQTDPYMRERLHDLDDLANRLLHQLTGRSFVAAHEDLPENSIIVARTMGPAALLDYDRSKLRGLVLEDAGATSHVAIVARALGIAAVGEVANIIDFVEQGDALIVDGSSGSVHVRPTADVEHAYAEKARLRAKRQEQYRQLRDVPAVTRDGVPVALHMNAGLLVDLQHVAETGAASIGLFRTEIQFMVVSKFPRMREQEAFYKAAFAEAGGHPITFRTLDIGSDKVLPYMTKVEEENPALGWRAIRIGLDRPGLLRMQLRAMLRAAEGCDLRIMFPMIATVEEFKLAKEMVEREVAHLKKHKRALPADLKLGVMLEVPALLWQLDELCAHADFLSVGTNDLLQYLFAADRDNKRVATRYDTLSVPMLRALKRIVDKAGAHKTPLSLCGEMGGHPLEALALIAIGFRDLSMSPACIGPVKAMVLATDLAALEAFLLPLMETIDGGLSLRSKLRGFAEAHHIPL